MTYQGRSLDDLPLAAYSGRAVDDEPEEAAAEPAHLSQQEAVALAMGIEPVAPAEPAAPAAPAPSDLAAAAASGAGGPRLSLPKPSLPRLSLPRLPRFGGRARAAMPPESPFNITAHPAGPSGYAPPASTYAPAASAYAPAASAYASSPFSVSAAQAPAARPLTGGVPAVPGARGRLPGVNLGDFGATLRNPRAAVRDPRVMFGGLIALGVVLLGAGMLGGGAGSGGAPSASARIAPAGGPTGPGPATIQVAGDFEATFSLTGTAAVGKPADGQLAATWDDGAGTSVTLTGRVGGTRTTSLDLTLAITVIRNDTPVTFTSEAGECTIGMAEKMYNVTGTFVCPEITSDGGRFTVNLTGTYST